MYSSSSPFSLKQYTVGIIKVQVQETDVCEISDAQRAHESVLMENWYERFAYAEKFFGNTPQIRFASAEKIYGKKNKMGKVRKWSIGDTKTYNFPVWYNFREECDTSYYIVDAYN